MHRISFVAAAVIAVVSADSAALRAQSFTGRPIQVGLTGGFTKPVGDLSPTATHAGNAGALLLVGAPNSHLRFRLDGQWQKITGKEAGSGQLECPNCTFFSQTTNYRILDATANAVYGGKLAGPFSLYMIAGVGVYNVRKTNVIHQDALVVTQNSGATRFGLNGGVGTSLRLGRVATFIEARFHQLLGGHVSASDGFSGELPGAFQFVPISVGIVF